MNCCCQYGAAVKGEWPEFECFYCPRHKGGMAAPDEMCKRHEREHTERCPKCDRYLTPMWSGVACSSRYCDYTYGI